jgi:two-component system LytT family sensor kinase
MDKTEKRICLYCSLLIALLTSSPRFLALRENGIVAHYWHFNLLEVLFQLVLTFAFCYLIFDINLKDGSALATYRSTGKYLPLVFYNFAVFFISFVVTGALQRIIFINSQISRLYWSGAFTRYAISFFLAGIMMKIILLLRESKQKDSENEQLKTAYLEAELELLKEQLNPHFLFNSLSSLSGIVREDPVKAQHFINHLSKIFRYALAKSGDHLVTLSDELKMIRSYEQLLLMRFEKAFELLIDIDEDKLDLKIPHLSLQPLLENAAKHNSATLANPLCVKVFMEDDKLIVSNNLQEVFEPENSNGIGLVNLNSRFRILMQRDIEIEKTKESFMVKLPLIKA